MNWDSRGRCVRGVLTVGFPSLTTTKLNVSDDKEIFLCAALTICSRYYDCVMLFSGCVKASLIGRELEQTGLNGLLRYFQ